MVIYSFIFLRSPKYNYWFKQDHFKKTFQKEPFKTWKPKAFGLSPVTNYV